MTQRIQTAAALTMLLVKDSEEEDKALASISALEARHGTTVVPVVAVNGLPRKLQRLWRRLGIAHRCVSHTRTPGRSVSRKRPKALPGLPDFVFVSSHVETGIVRLVESLLRGPVIRLEEAHNHPRLSTARREQTALVLLALDDVTPEAFSALHSISDRGLVLGTTFVEAGWQGRFVVIKSLTTGHVSHHGAFRIFAQHHEEGSKLAPRPASISSKVVRLPAKHSDVLVIAGHANSWDLVASPDLIVCARAGVKDAAKATGVLPCFQGAECVRQLELGREAQARDGLIAMSRLRSNVLVLWGCGVTRLGAGMRYGLVYQACLSDALAVIATTGGIGVDPGEHALLFGLIADGTPLGQAVADVNKTMQNRHSVGRHGALMLFGNPSLRLIGRGPVTAKVSPTADGVTMRIPTSPTREPDGCLVKTTASQQTSQCVYIRPPSPGTWFHGGYLPDGRGYFWAKSNPGASQNGSLNIGLVPLPDDAQSTRRTTAIQLASALSWWPSILDKLRRGRTGDDVSDRFDEWLSKIPGVLWTLEGRAQATPPWRFTLREYKNNYGSDDIPAEATTLCEGLLDCLLDGVRLFGLQRLAALPPGSTLDSEMPHADGTCVCNRGSLCSRHFVLEGQRETGYLERRCEACGAMVADDGRLLMRLVHCDTTVKRGAKFSYSLSCSAPGEEHVHVAHAGIIAPWMKSSGNVVTSAHAVVVRAGSQSILREEIAVPDSFSPGQSRAVLVAVVNGSFWFFGWNLDVT